MSVYTYNNVTLQHCKTLLFEVKTERDPSNTDVLWRRYTVRVRGFLATGPDAFPGLSDPLDSAATLNQVKVALTTPRCPFSFTVGSNVLVQVPSSIAKSTIDARLGPDPEACVVREITSGVFLVEHGVVCRIVDCPPGCEDVEDPVVSLRWTQSESFDVNWNSTLETQGLLIVRSDLLESADSFRELATPPVLPNYQRETSRYTLSPDGLQLQFHFRDVEVDRLPPYPATSAEGRFTINMNQGGVRTGQVDLTLRGINGTNRGLLLIVALRMAFAKLDAEGFMSVPQVVWGTMSEDLFVPSVSVSIQGMLSMAGYDSRGDPRARYLPGTTIPAPSLMYSVDQLLGYDDAKTPQDGIAPPVRKKILGLVAAAFRDPCGCSGASTDVVLKTDPGTGDPSGTPPSGTTPPPPPPPMIDIGPTTDPTKVISTALVSDRAPYDHYEVDVTYEWDEGRVHLPATGSEKTGKVSSVVQASGGRMQMLVCWVAMRTGLPPVLPAYESPDPNVVPLGGAIVAKNVTPSADGSMLSHAVSGWYRYAILDPQKVRLAAPTPPFLATLATEAAKDSVGFFTRNILWKFLGETGPNPFNPESVKLDETPSPSNSAVGTLTLPYFFAGLTPVFDVEGIVWGPPQKP